MQPSEPSDDTWFTSLRHSGAEAPLFCVCASGGDVFDFRDLADALPGDRPFHVFGIPTQGEHAQFLAVEQLAALYLQKMRELQAAGPYYLCGHSFGGIVAYEMARQLAATGQGEVGLLALIETEHPRLVQNLPAWRKAQFKLVYLYDRTTKYSKNMLNLQFGKIIADIRKFTVNHSKQLLWKVLQSVVDRTGRRIPEKIRSVEMIAEAAWCSYVPGPYHGPVLLLNAGERTAEYRGDAQLGWGHCVTGPITTHIVPGDHLNIMHPPQVETLAAWLSRHLGAGATVAAVS